MTTNKGIKRQVLRELVASRAFPLVVYGGTRYPGEEPIASTGARRL